MPGYSVAVGAGGAAIAAAADTLEAAGGVAFGGGLRGAAVSAPAVMARKAGEWRIAAAHGSWQAFEAPEAADVRAAAHNLGADVVFVLGEPGELPGDLAAGGWRSVDGGVTVVIPALDEGRSAGLWDGLEPGELLETFRRLEQLGIPWRDSVGRTAEALILSTHPRAKGGVILGSSPVVPDVCEDGTLEQPWGSWVRPPTDGERGARWAHFFDANAQYLAAWQSVEVGTGTPEHVADDGKGWLTAAPSAWPVGFYRLPGLDRVSVPGLLPAPWLPRREWVSTPTLRRAVEVCDALGVELPAIAEAWVWPSRTRFFRGAGERLRDARAAAREQAALARGAVRHARTEQDAMTAVRGQVVAVSVLDAVKALYTVQTGRLSMLTRDSRSGWRRPDWGHLIRAQARANLHRRISALTAAPVAIATDGLCFLSDEVTGLEFARQIGLPMGDGLGAFKYEGSVPASAVLPALEAAAAGAAGGVGPVWAAGREALHG